MENCNTNTSVVPDNTPLECNDYKSTKCVLHPTGISFLNLSANSTQEQINNALVLALISAVNRIQQLENQL